MPIIDPETVQTIPADHRATAQIHANLATRSANLGSRAVLAGDLEVAQTHLADAARWAASAEQQLELHRIHCGGRA